MRRRSCLDRACAPVLFVANRSGRELPASIASGQLPPCCMCSCRFAAQGSMAPAYTPIRGPFLKHAFAKSVDKGEDAWLQQRNLPCADGARPRSTPFLVPTALAVWHTSQLDFLCANWLCWCLRWPVKLGRLTSP